MKKNAVICFILLFLIQAPRGMAAEKLTLMLDWFPNVDHLPVYMARQRGAFEKNGIRLEIVSPSDTADALKLAAAGHVDLAVSYEPQTVIAAARGLDILAVGRLIEHPLTTLLYLEASGIQTPADLNGKNIGYTVPGLMDLLLDAFAAKNGITGYKPVNVGFAIVQSLVSGKVDAIMGPFKTYETVTLKQHGYDAAYFSLEKYGIPDYDELVFICGKSTLSEKKEQIASFVRIVDDVIAEMRRDPEAAIAAYFEAVPQADRSTETEAFHLTLPYYAGTQTLDAQRWQVFADFAHASGLIDRPVDARTIIRNMGK